MVGFVRLEGNGLEVEEGVRTIRELLEYAEHWTIRPVAEIRHWLGDDGHMRHELTGKITITIEMECKPERLKG